MFRKSLFTGLAFAVISLAPMVARADDKEVYDGRLEGYQKTVQLDVGGTSLDWLLFVGLTVLALGGLFKSANRTHLD